MTRDEETRAWERLAAEQRKHVAARTTPKQRLEWLWQMKLFAARAKKAAETRRLAKRGS